MFSKKRVFFLLGVAVLAFASYIFFTWYYQSIPQAGIGLLNTIPNPTAGDKVLVFAPHPDDETIAVGGYIKTATKAGADVSIVLVTNGNKHHLEKSRYNEFAQVTASLGVPEANLIYLNHPDGGLSKEDRGVLTKEFKNIILHINPNIIFVPSLNDRHPDHRITGEIAKSAIGEIGNNINTYFYLVHFPNFPQPFDYDQNLFLLPPLKLLGLNKVWLSFPLTKEIETDKYNALMKYKTQLKYPFPKEIILASIRRNELFEIEK